jgi:hypothetical protein
VRDGDDDGALEREREGAEGEARHRRRAAGAGADPATNGKSGAIRTESGVNQV